MEKYFNSISIVIGLVGGATAALLGGWDVLLQALITLVVIDYITGLMSGYVEKTLSSEVGFIGLMRKVMIFMVIATAYVIGSVIGDAIPLREIVIVFYISNEGLSILENVSPFLPVPKKLKDAMVQVRDSNEEEEEK